MKRPGTICVAATLFCVAPIAVQAQPIYPLNRAEILAGAKFDLKVEFPDAPSAASARVTINGADAATVVGKSASVVEREDGGNFSAYWIRDAVLSKPGRYTVEATAGQRKASVTWEVFDTPAAKAKNVILFIGSPIALPRASCRNA